MTSKSKSKKQQTARTETSPNVATIDCATQCQSTLEALERFIREVEALTVDRDGERCISTFPAAPRLTHSYQGAVDEVSHLSGRLYEMYAKREFFSEGPVIERATTKIGEGGIPQILASAIQGLTFALAWPPTVPDFVEKDGREVLAPRFKFGDKIEAQAWAEIQTGTRALRLHIEETHGAKEPLAPSELEIAHARDFTWLSVRSRRYSFSTGNQARTIETLYEEWQKGGDGAGLGEGEIGEAISSEATRFRVQATFHKHPALGTILRACGKGRYALYLSENLRKSAE